MVIDAVRYKEIVDNLYDGVYIVDRDRVITYWNTGAERLTGYGADEVIGRSCRDNLLNHVTPDGTLLCQASCPLLATMEDGSPREANVFLHHAEGHRVPVSLRCAPLRDDQGEVIGAVETFTRDVGLKSVRRELRELRRTALTDALTGVGNRALLDGRLRALIAEYAKRPGGAAVMMVDIDHFKRVNDTHGHQVGDRVLRMVAATLQQSLRSSDALGRWGGDEFLAILHDVDDAALATVGDKLRRMVSWSRLDLDDHVSVKVSVSVGATLLRPGDTNEALVDRADAALYQSKRAGRDRVTVG